MTMEENSNCMAHEIILSEIAFDFESTKLFSL